MLSSLLGTFPVFCLVGAVSTAIDIGLLYILVEKAHLPVLFAATIALLAASINGYTLNKLLTFRDDSEKVKRQYMLYLFVSLVGLGLTLVLLSLFINVFGLYYIHAKVLTVVIVVAWNFGANRTFVFKNRKL